MDRDSRAWTEREENQRRISERPLDADTNSGSTQPHNDVVSHKVERAEQPRRVLLSKIHTVKGSYCLRLNRGGCLSGESDGRRVERDYCPPVQRARRVYTPRDLCHSREFPFGSSHRSELGDSWTLARIHGRRKRLWLFPARARLLEEMPEDKLREVA